LPNLEPVTTGAMDDVQLASGLPARAAVLCIVGSTSPHVLRCHQRWRALSPAPVSL
jgi:hypothetical protein